jgi:hypothetical protein
VVGKRVPGGWGWSTFYSVDKLSIEKWCVFMFIPDWPFSDPYQ